jgi:ribosomal protein S18 acetylase RimI-like enzyme
MDNHMAPLLVAKTALSPDDIGQVQTLADRCNKAEGLDLKLTLPTGQSDAIVALLCSTSSQLVGYCSLDDDEVCGMVHPAHRGQGIGQRLLAGIREQARQRYKPSLLLICEAASASGQAFAAAQGGSHAFSEHRMTLHTLPTTFTPDPHIQLQPASLDDLETLTQIIAASFGDPEEMARQNITQGITAYHDQFYLARQDGTPAGALKIIAEPPRAGIYAFGVLPSLQGRGIGRQMLFQVCQRLFADGYQAITLEVETDNAPALHVYRACGFQTSTTYQYYRVQTETETP